MKELRAVHLSLSAQSFLFLLRKKKRRNDFANILPTPTAYSKYSKMLYHAKQSNPLMAWLK